MTGPKPYIKKGYEGYKPAPYIKKGYNPNSANNRMKFKRGGPVGARNPNWKGGICSLSELIRRLPENKKWKHEVFERDNFTCQDCEVKGGILHAHHIKPFSIIVEEFLKLYNMFSPIDDKETLVRLALAYEPFWDLANGLTLCQDCHLQRKGGNHG